jgi:hypothetical protein
VNPDPIGFDGGMNWYAYAGGNPVNFVDPSGLTTTHIAWQSTPGNISRVTMTDESLSTVQRTISSMPSHSIVALEFIGHGSSSSIQIERNGAGLRFYDGESMGIPRGVDFSSGSVQEFSNFVEPYLSKGCAIFLSGCETALGVDNISRQLSVELPDATVRGYTDSPIGNEFSFFGQTLYRLGEESRIWKVSGTTKTYFRGDEIRPRTPYQSYENAANYYQQISNPANWDEGDSIK